MKLSTRKNSNIKRRTSQKLKKKFNKIKKNKNKYIKKTHKNNLKGGGWWKMPFLSGNTDDLKLVRRIELDNEILDLALSKSIKLTKSQDGSYTPGDIEFELSDIIDYALFALNLKKECSDICESALCEGCPSPSSQCTGICKEIKAMVQTKPSYVHANMCRLGFMDDYGGKIYNCAKYIIMAAILTRVRERFNKMDPLYILLDYFRDSYKGLPNTAPTDTTSIHYSFDPDPIIEQLNTLKLNLKNKST